MSPTQEAFQIIPFQDLETLLQVNPQILTGVDVLQALWDIDLDAPNQIGQCLDCI